MTTQSATLVEPPAYLEAAADFRPRLELSQAEVAAWDRDGFHIHAEPLFSSSEVDEIKAACERVAHRTYATQAAPGWRAWEPDAPPTRLCKIDNGWPCDPVILAAATSPRLGRISAQLLGAYGIRLWHDQYLRKPRSGGGVVPWHQDWMYWQEIDRCRTVTCWIALADVSLDMGPMVFLQGSHRAGLRMDLKPEDYTGDSLRDTPLAAEYPMVPVVVRAGQVSFHHGATMHGSDRNDTPHDRVSLVAHVMASDCCYKQGAPGSEHMCIKDMKRFIEHPGDGERFRGPQFPWAWGVDR